MSENEQQNFYSAQIMRLKPLRFFPADDIARGELAKALWRHSADEDHASRIVDYCQEHGCGADGRECPTTVDFARLASEVPARLENLVPASATCPHCEGCGWELVKKRGNGIFSDQVYDHRRRCRCRKGGAA